MFDRAAWEPALSAPNPQVGTRDLGTVVAGIESGAGIGSRMDVLGKEASELCRGVIMLTNGTVAY